MGTGGGAFFWLTGNGTTFVFPELETAIAVNVMLLGGAPGSVDIVFSGPNGTASYSVATGAGATFFGIGNPSGFASVSLSTNGAGGALVDNITFGDDPPTGTVPEPASLILFGTSCLGPAMALRRRARLR